MKPCDPGERDQSAGPSHRCPHRAAVTSFMRIGSRRGSAIVTALRRRLVERSPVPCRWLWRLQPPERVAGSPLHRLPRTRRPRAAGIRSERVLKTAQKQGRALAAAVVAPELEVVLLACHAGHDVADPAPRVEAAVQELELRLARLKAEEAEGGAEGGTPVHHGSGPSAVAAQTAAAGPRAACVAALLLWRRE